MILLAIAEIASVAVPGLKRLGQTAPGGAVATGAPSWAWGFWTVLATVGAVALAVAVVCALGLLVRFAWQVCYPRNNRAGH